MGGIGEERGGDRELCAIAPKIGRKNILTKKQWMDNIKSRSLFYG
jgi:hypothetical protein